MGCDFLVVPAPRENRKPIDLIESFQESDVCDGLCLENE